MITKNLRLSKKNFVIANKTYFYNVDKKIKTIWSEFLAIKISKDFRFKPFIIES